MAKKIAVITGANRGIGLEVARQLAQGGVQVILTARNQRYGKAAAKKLNARITDVRFFPLDVTKEKSIQKLAQHIKKEYGHLDILVNNAGVLLDYKKNAISVSMRAVRDTLETNALGPLRVAQVLFPLMKKRGNGRSMNARIINVSSGYGSLSSMEGNVCPAYKIAKAALNAVTRILANNAVTQQANILVNAVSPGWVRTRMGGMEAELPVEKGAETIVWLATDERAHESGCLWENKQKIPW